MSETKLTYTAESGVSGKFVETAFDEKGILAGIRFNHEDDYNFAFDTVDAIAAKAPDKEAMIYVSNAKEERRFTFGDMSRYSSQKATASCLS